MEDGYKLWLRHEPAKNVEQCRKLIRQVVVTGKSATAKIIRDELTAGLGAMLGQAVEAGEKVSGDGAVVVHVEKTGAGPEGFVIRSAKVEGHAATVIASESEIGALYGAFHLLRLVATRQLIDKLDITQRPKLKLRLLNHWDNLDGTIERGYGGKSLWKWDELPGKIDSRYTDYARVNASVGINGSVVNNVNTNPRILSAEYLKKVAALADVWRPWGIRVYLSVNFASPRQIGGLDSNDPDNPAVQKWWRDKVAEIYKLIPDFGGFLVKANSEGQPGPQDYDKTHADGANLLADALQPHGGVVMWRAFVYEEKVDPDRTKRAYVEFTALDGKFRPNVIVQVKNGPLDFMPREPFHPLFGVMTKSPVIAELQAAQEYLGHSRHLVYLGTMWKEVLDAETYATGPRGGASVGKVLDGSIYPYHLTGMCAVANTGTDRNWCGHEFSQANWYAFGRLAWDHTLGAEQIAEEWTRQTLSHDDAVVRTIVEMMMSSRRTFVNYTMPLGLHHLIGGDHYEPMPWVDRHESSARIDWTAVFYHRADRTGIGVDRSSRGTGATTQYFPPLCDTYDDPRKCPDELLLWFHRLPWDYKMRSGRTLWEELCAKYRQGAEGAKQMAATWEKLKGKIDDGQHQRVSERFKLQTAHAAKWRDEGLAYWSKVSGKKVV